MSSKYRVLVVGMGKRGMHHAATFHANPRFEVVAVCDIDQARLEAAAAKLGNPKTSTDAPRVTVTKARHDSGTAYWMRGVGAAWIR